MIEKPEKRNNGVSDKEELQRDIERDETLLPAE